MCGIVGYKGNNKPKDILLNCLKKLEYRGYDSSGIALFNKGDTQIIKSVGKIKNLEDKINDIKSIDSSLGIAHTRWATHGKVNEENAHPHTYGKITLVHNGIIENAKELKDELISEGVKFNSSTDTEVIAALIDYYYESDMKEAINKAIKRLKGSYALAIISEDENKLYAVRCESPLILGIGDNEYFVTSDIGAILSYTNKYVLLGENEIVTLTKDNYSIEKDNKPIERKVEVSNLSIEDTSLNGYDHFMMKEINEEPVLVDN